jgi:hypothetical protein
VRVDSIICNGTQNSMAALLSSQKQFFFNYSGKVPCHVLFAHAVMCARRKKATG